MAKVSRFEDLLAWQKARSLVKAIYTATAVPPFSRDFPMKDQIRGAALPVPSNIAEGFERGGLPEFQHFLSIAKASCGEVRSQLYSAVDVGNLDEKTMTRLMDQASEVARIVGGLRSAIEREIRHPDRLRTQNSELRTARTPCS